MDLFVMTSFQNGRHFLKKCEDDKFKICVYMCDTSFILYNGSSELKFNVKKSIWGHKLSKSSLQGQIAAISQKSWYFKRIVLNICVIHHFYYTMVVLISNSMWKSWFEVMKSVKGHFKVKWPAIFQKIDILK